jgi:hypothetical protein
MFAKRTGGSAATGVNRNVHSIQVFDDMVVNSDRAISSSLGDLIRPLKDVAYTVSAAEEAANRHELQ